MARFQKTRIHAATAVLVLLVLYALGGMVYAMVVHNPDSVVIWAAIAGVALIAALAYQRYVTVKRARATQQP